MVECHSGSAFGERPLAVHWQGQRLPVAAVEARWREPGKLCFRVRSVDGRTFHLAYQEYDDEWQVELT
jgi:hypothetical protein